MTCEEFREAAPLLALFGEEPDAEHLAHPECLAALRRANDAVEALALALPGQRPPAQLWERVRASAIGPRMPLRERLAWFIAAAACALLALTLVTRRQLAHRNALLATSWVESSAHEKQANAEKESCLRALSSMRETDAQVREALALAASPKSQLLSLEAKAPGAPAARAIVDGHRAVVLASALPPHPGDFQLWLVRGSTPVPAGLLRAGPGGAAIASIDPQLFSTPADAVAISLEPSGGSPNGKPTQVVAVGALPRS